VNAKFSMVTALPATGVLDPVDGGWLAEPAEGDGMALIPGIPGVVLAPEPKLIDGLVEGVVAGGDEQATASITIAGAANL
jgi:hypothetical protein